MPEFVYVVFQNADTIEGRGPMMMRAIWSDLGEAMKHAQSLESYGDTVKKSDGKYGYIAYGSLTHIKEMMIMDSFEDMTNQKIENDRKVALGKLTDREKKILGLT